MNKTALCLVTACGLVVSAAVWGGPVVRVGNKVAEGAATDAQPKSEPVKWEYAELRRTSHLYWNVATTGEAQPDPEIILHLPDKTHKSDTLAGLTGPLGQKPKQETAAEVLSILGQDGWEPVGLAATEWVNPGRWIKRVEVWGLKRPAKR